MDSGQIRSILSTDRFAKRYFKGVFPRDYLSSFRPVKGQSLYVLNTAVSGRKGTHWIALYFSGQGGECEFFYPLGLKPELYSDIYRFIKLNSNSTRHNWKMLQHPASQTCGLYVVYFCLQKGRGRSLNRILSLFNNSNQSGNDFLIKQLTDIRRY